MMRLVCGVLTVLTGLSATATASSEDFTFFETHVRPVLVNHCYECHSAESHSLKGKLRLDTKEGMLRGGVSGKPAVVPGNADTSKLVEAIRYQNDALQMPPKQALPPDVIERLVVWINEGASDPRTGDAAPAAAPADASEFWSFQAPQQPRIPRVRDISWPRTPIDQFILAKLEANGLRPAAPADPRTLIRRLTFGLTGLPPSPEDVDAFLSDASPTAYDARVEQLLASPHYGERWGRMWLDVARYADTKGYVYGDREDPRFLHSYVYRDWVVRAFNEDLPYDRFLMLQIAADQIPDAPKTDLAAMGFLTLGRRFLGVVPDIVDDRIDVVMRGTQGLTLSCARCHDHKFDPISMRDYYGLYGIFASSSERTVCLDDNPEPSDAYAEFKKGYDERVKKLSDTFQQKRAELADRIRGQIVEHMVALLDVKKLPTDDFYEIRQPNEVIPTVVRAWQAYVDKKPQGDPVWDMWKAVTAIPEADFAAQAPAVIASFVTGDHAATTNPALRAPFENATPQTRVAFAEQFGATLKSAHDAWQNALKSAEEQKASPPEKLADSALETLRQELYAEASPVWVPNGAIVDVEWYFDEPTRVELSKLQKEIDNHIIESTASPMHAVILADKPEPKNAPIFLRGNPANRGEEVPRRFLTVLAKNESPVVRGSGRLDLANAIANPANPLTARVIVNRIWLEHFGSGLVDTPSDFGTRCEPPAHPELLDWLAVWFMDNGWSIKKLHRLIVTSSVYQQASTPAGHAEPRFANSTSGADPQNKLYSHFNRRRLTFEEMRDALLCASGELDRTLGGRPVNLTAEPFAVRRTLYGYVDRQFMPGVYRVFDYPNPDMHSPKRFDTTVPQQALFFMNSPFLMGRAKALIEQIAASHTTPADRIRAMYRSILQREPSENEIGRAIEFIAASAPVTMPQPPKPVSSAWQYGYGEFDPVRIELLSFQSLPYFNGDAWQGGAAWPDAKLGWLRITADGGHAGDDHQHAAIRRWISPVNATVSIAAELHHPKAEGDGVQGLIFASGQGMLGTWIAHNAKVETKIERVRVKKGDTIEFVVDLRENISHDEFTWAPEITVANPSQEMEDGGEKTTWTAAQEFGDVPAPPVTPLSPWEQYAQVLLLTNEFVFLD